MTATRLLTLGSQKIYMHVLFVLVVVITIVLAGWSWVLVDPNLTLYPHADWTSFREAMMIIGRGNRLLSSHIFMPAVLFLAIFHLLVSTLASDKILSYKWIIYIAILLGLIIGLLSYPALSHDLFNYIFDAKIATFYHENPYLKRAMDYPMDQDLRFMHWIHRTYPYGPTFLLLSIIPSLVGMGKFGMTFVLFKLCQVFIFIHSARLIAKLDRAAAVVFITSPIILIEGLMNTHNDFVSVWLALIGIYFAHKNKLWLSLILMLLSGLTKYFTLPLVLIPMGLLMGQFVDNWKHRVPPALKLMRRALTIDVLTGSAFLGVIGLILYLWITNELHAWYLLNLFVFVPYLKRMAIIAWPFLTWLLLSYYPYVYGGDWGQGGDVQFKKNIQYQGVHINIFWILLIGSLFAIYKRKARYLAKKAHDI